MKHTFERYCKDYENIENYEAAKKDNFKCWECPPGFVPGRLRK